MNCLSPLLQPNQISPHVSDTVVGAVGRRLRGPICSAKMSFELEKLYSIGVEVFDVFPVFTLSAPSSHAVTLTTPFETFQSFAPFPKL